MKLSRLCSEFKYECLSGSMDVDVRDVILHDSRKITERQCLSAWWGYDGRT